MSETEGIILQGADRDNLNMNSDTEVELDVEKDKPKKKRTTKRDLEIEIEIQKLKLANELKIKEMEHEVKMKELEIQLLSKTSADSKTNPQAPIKLKIQPFDQSNDDILSYITEFETISEQLRWTEEVKILQLRTLVKGEARDIIQSSSTSFNELRKALIDRFGKKPAEYFKMLLALQRRDNETYRGLKSRINLYLKRFTEERDILEAFSDEFFLRALPAHQAQWVRRNKGESVVEAAEDYIMPDSTFKQIDKNLQQQQQPNVQQQKSDIECFRCRNRGHVAAHCPMKNRDKSSSNLASYFVKSNIGQRLIYIPGLVNNENINFVKDTGTDMTLLREDLVDASCIIDGQYMELFTAIGQPFRAKVGVVNMDTPHYKGPLTVGLVPGLAAEGLLVYWDVLNRREVPALAVTRAQAARNERIENEAEDSMRKCEVQCQALKAINDNDVDVEELIEASGELVEPPGEQCSVALANVNAVSLGKLQKEDNSLKEIHEKACETGSEVGDIPNAFPWTFNILYRKWKSAKNMKSVKVKRYALFLAEVGLYLCRFI